MVCYQRRLVCPQRRNASSSKIQLASQGGSGWLAIIILWFKSMKEKTVTQNFIGVCSIRSLISTVARPISCVSAKVTRTTAAFVAAAGLLMVSPAQAVFFTSGQFNATPSGGASYTIPIVVPPGTSGMTPSLALSYNSQGGNGLFGMGWSLSGLSAISRCPKTFIQDGVKSGVNYTVTDSLCLDGQRLVVVPGANGIKGAYGGNGTEYRTEAETFSRIISYGTSGSPVSGPHYFKVWTKSGQIMEFGNTAASSIETQGPAPGALLRPIRAWAVNKITDSKGNYLTIMYAKDTVTWGSYVPTSILYTGNATSTPALLPYSHVDFHLLARTDTQIAFDGGSQMGTPWLIDHIYTYTLVNGIDTLVKDYRLTYDISAATQRSRITQLKECDGIAATAVCLQPTTFGWQGSAEGIFAKSTTFNITSENLQLSNNTVGITLGDFNGDGKTDILRLGDAISSNALFLSKGDGSFTKSTNFNIASEYLQLSNNTIGIVLGDFNGDGKTDILRRGDVITNNALFLSNGDGSFTKSTKFNITTENLQLSNNTFSMVLGDFDGDGKTDILRCGDVMTNNALFFSNGDGSFTKSTVFNIKAENLQLSNNTVGITLGDFNGDGKTDILRRGDVMTNNALFLSNGDGSFTKSTAFNITTENLQLSNNTFGIVLGDFNGDGKTDILRRGDVVTNNALFLSSGNGSFKKSTTFNITGEYLQHSNNTVGIVLGDFNGDGKTDILRRWDTMSSNALFLSNGDGTFIKSTAFNITGEYLQHSNNTVGIALGDFNGDGRTDILRRWDAMASNALFMESTLFPDLLTTIINGLGATTAISYKPLTDATVYTKDLTSVYPVMDFQAPMYVISSASSSNGIGSNYTSNYNYVGAKSHLTGGGFLGFRQTISTDAQTKIVNTTSYRQDYPYHGLPLTAQKNTSAGVVINNVSNTWVSSVNTAWSAQYHVPQLTQSVESSYELSGGAPITTVTTNTTYDTYGNPTVINVSTQDGYSKTITNTYVNDTTVNWYLGRLTRTTVSSTQP